MSNKIIEVINILSTDNFYNISENIEIAKGKYAYPKSFKQAINKIKRVFKWQKI